MKPVTRSCGCDPAIPIRIEHCRRQLRLRHGLVGFIQASVEQFAHPCLDHVGQSARDDDERFLGLGRHQCMYHEFRTLESQRTGKVISHRQQIVIVVDINILHRFSKKIIDEGRSFDFCSPETKEQTLLLQYYCEFKINFKLIHNYS